MKIAFTGKGGSGKTTISSLFARYAAQEQHRVLALDADINQHMAEAFGFSGTVRSMGSEIETIKAYLAGSNPLFVPAVMHKTTPPGRGSQLLSLNETDWFVREFTSQANGVRIAGAGSIPRGNVGVRCYHGLNGAIELVLGHMVDRPDDVVVVDMTAGADAFSSSLFTKVDMLVLVVEPTLKSLSVYDQFLPYANEYNIPLIVVGNKVETEEDRAFIENRVKTLGVYFGPSSFVRRRERGEDIGFDEIDTKTLDSLGGLMAITRTHERDWQKLEQNSHVMHLKNIHNILGNPAEGHIDKEFSLQEAAKKLLA